jgi:hypothetical protein
VPLSGALRYRGNGADVDIYVRGAEPLKAEVKARGEGSGFRTLERWLGNNDVLFLMRDRATPLVVVPMHVWMEIVSLSALCADPDGDADRCARRRGAEQGALPPADAIAREAA